MDSTQDAHDDAAGVQYDAEEPKTTYTVHLPSTWVQTTDAERAEQESRAGRLVTAVTEGPRR